MSINFHKKKLDQNYKGRSINDVALNISSTCLSNFCTKSVLIGIVLGYPSVLASYCINPN